MLKTIVVVMTTVLLAGIAFTTAAGSEQKPGSIVGQTPGVNERIVEAARLYGEARTLNLEVSEPGKWLAKETDRRLSLLRQAREQLLLITEEHAGSPVAVAVLSGQAFGPMSLVRIEAMIEKLLEAQCLRNPASGCILKLLEASIQAVEDTRTRQGLLTTMNSLLERFELKEFTFQESCRPITMGCQIGQPGYCFSRSTKTVRYVRRKQARKAIPAMSGVAIAQLGSVSGNVEEWKLTTLLMHGGACASGIIQHLREARVLQDPKQRTETLSAIIGDIENENLSGGVRPTLANKHCKALLAEIVAVDAPRLRAELLMAAFPYPIAHASLGADVSDTYMVVTPTSWWKWTKSKEDFMSMFD